MSTFFDTCEPCGRAQVLEVVLDLGDWGYCRCTVCGTETTYHGEAAQEAK